MSVLRKLAGETAIYGISSILSRLLNWVILTPYLTRVFSDQADYGIISEMYTYTALLLVFFTFRMETTFFRFGSQKGYMELSFSKASLSVLVLTLALGGLLLSNAQALANFIEYPEHPDFIRWIVFIIAFDALAAIPFARLRLESRPVRFAILKILGILVNILLIFFFLEACPWLVDNGWESWISFYQEEDRIGYIFLSNLIASGVVLLFLLPLYANVKLKQAGPEDVIDQALGEEEQVGNIGKVRKPSYQKMFFYALPLVVAGLAAVINQLIGIPMLRALGDVDLEKARAMAGVYGAVAKLAVIMNLFTQAFNYAAEPFFFRNAQEENANQTYADVAKAFALVGSLAFLGVICYLDVLQYFLGKSYREGLEIVPFLLAAYFFLGLFYNFSIWYKLEDMTRFGGYIAVGGSIITIGLNWILIPNFGIYGPAWSALACYCFMAAASYWTGRRYKPIPYPMRRIASYFLMASAGVLLSMWLRPQLEGQLGLSLLINTLVFLTIIGLFISLERKYIKRIFLK
jgi:O-antigen/teichoic acid export membrane protein